MRHSMLILFLMGLLAGCGGDRGVWFVHVTDPHFFEEITDPTKLPDPRKKTLEDAEQARQFREGHARETFSILLRDLGSLPGREGKPDFLVVTGDFGIDRFLPQRQQPQGPAPPAETAAQNSAPGSSTSATGDTRGETPAPVQKEDRPPSEQEIEEAVKILADRLDDSPVRDIYMVPGNNDVAQEDASSKALADTLGFFDRVQAKIAGKGVVLHDLSACYLGDREPLSKCYADIPNTPFRLVGFSSYSFKNKGARYDRNTAEQEKQAEKLGQLVQLARDQGKKALVLTHVPELDDPFSLGQQHFAGVTAQKKELPVASAWNVSPKVFARWNEIVGSEAVIGVLAGHFHDAHREIYSPPYPWISEAARRTGLEKLYVAPPLAARLQDSSPIQARGVAVFDLSGNRLRRQLYWYDGVAKTFQADTERSELRGEGGREVQEEPGLIQRFLAWMSSLPEDQEQLGRAAVLLIAFLAAFLTVVQVWQIPPPTSSPARSAPEAQAEAGANTASGAADTTPTSIFQTNLGRTVASGLTGLAVVAFLDDFWKQTQLDEKAYYLVLFSTFFLAMLFLSAGLRGFGEALRSRVVIYRRPHSHRQSYSHSASPDWKGGRIWRLGRWLLSWRSALLVFLDTVFNVIQGRNQVHSVVFEEAIVNLHWSIVWTADRIRDEVDRAVTRSLAHCKLDPGDIRVSVLVMSDGAESLISISSERGSAAGPCKDSPPWSAVQSGQARWWKLDDPKGTTKWGDIYKDATFWNESDHRAFVVFPVPWARQAETLDYRMAGLYLSFKDADCLQDLWEGLESENAPNYGCWTALLDPEPSSKPQDPAQPSDQKAPVRIFIKNRELRAVLHQALEVLGESLRYFNPMVFKERIHPYRRN